MNLAEMQEIRLRKAGLRRKIRAMKLLEPKTKELQNLIDLTELEILENEGAYKKAVENLTQKLEGAGVPESVKSIFYLRYCEGKEWAEIAKMLNYSQSSVYKLHSKWKNIF